MAVDLIAAPLAPRGDAHAKRALSQSLRRTGAVLALLPLTAILAVKAAQLGTQTLVNIYGIGVLTSTIVIMYVAFSNYRDPSADAAELAAAPLLSCLIAVRNDVDLIERCVRSLLGQTYRNLEIIVVDDLSDDGTRELLIRLEAELPLRVILLDGNVGKKGALTLAAAQAAGEFFLFTDSDCVLDRRAAERCMLAFQAHPGLGAVSGHARALNADQNILTRTQDVWYDGQ
ncbi:MAG TPA: glycosyltransferase family 2 protein, partial [Mycobacteriales bacterium]|nr:glycosyltransferase family 2 protein [Mycobacteriales bacterium]